MNNYKYKTFFVNNNLDHDLNIGYISNQINTILIKYYNKPYKFNYNDLSIIKNTINLCNKIIKGAKISDSLDKLNDYKLVSKIIFNKVFLSFLNIEEKITKNKIINNTKKVKEILEQISNNLETNPENINFVINFFKNLEKEFNNLFLFT